MSGLRLRKRRRRNRNTASLRVFIGFFLLGGRRRRFVQLVLAHHSVQLLSYDAFLIGVVTGFGEVVVCDGKFHAADKPLKPLFNLDDLPWQVRFLREAA